MTEFIPAVLRLFSNWQFEFDIGVMPSEVTLVYFLEFISFLAWLVAFIWVSKWGIFKRERISPEAFLIKANWRRDNGNMVDTGKKGYSRWKIQSRSLAFLTLVCLIYASLLFAENRGYNADLILGRLDWLFLYAIKMAGPVFALYLFAMGKIKVGFVPYLVGIVVSFFTLAAGMASGSRGPIIGPVVWLTFLLLFVRKSRLIMIVVASGLLVVGLFHFEMTEIRGAMLSSRGVGIIGRINAIVNLRKETKGRSQQPEIFDAIEWRFGETSRLSVAFLRLVDDCKSAGLRPIFSALYAPLPRRFFPDKPEPGSVDGKQATMGMYIIQGVIRGAPWNMSGFFTGLHAYWELGWVGLIIFSVGAACYVAVLTHLFGRLGLAGLPMLLIVFTPWGLNPKLCIYTIILEIFHTLFPLMMIWYIIKFISRLRIIHVKKQIV